MATTTLTYENVVENPWVPPVDIDWSQPVTIEGTGAGGVGQDGTGISGGTGGGGGAWVSTTAVLSEAETYILTAQALNAIFADSITELLIAAGGSDGSGSGKGGQLVDCLGDIIKEGGDAGGPSVGAGGGGGEAASSSGFGNSGAIGVGNTGGAGGTGGDGADGGAGGDLGLPGAAGVDFGGGGGGGGAAGLGGAGTQPKILITYTILEEAPEPESTPAEPVPGNGSTRRGMYQTPYARTRGV